MHHDVFPALLTAALTFAAVATSLAKPPSPPPFTCPVLPPPAAPPVHAHHIRPNDVKACLAMGYSITAALVAKESFQVNCLRECRGILWCIGGDRDACAVPNFFARVPGLAESPAHSASSGDKYAWGR